MGAPRKWTENEWSEARRHFVESETATYVEVAEKFGITVRSVRARAAASRENWMQLREERRAAEREAELRLMQQSAELNASAQVESRATYRRAARALLQKVVSGLQEANIPPDGLTKLASALERAQTIEWRAFGIAAVTEGGVKTTGTDVVEIPVGDDEPGEFDAGDK